MIRCKLFLFLCLLTSNLVYSQVISYHPNKHWRVPGRLQISSQKPAFNTFFPQYGFSKRLSHGKWQVNEWAEWSKQNAFSAAYVLNGHSWQAVVERNKEIFQRHPEYLAEINGKRVGYEKTTKFCVSNKDLQALFIKDRINAFEENKDPKGSVSVEPSDGDGFCECSKCKNLGSISNQVFYLANITAKALRKQFPDGKVNLLAYYLHAKLPDFDLEPNVHVTVVPEGFQNDYDTDVMLTLWAKKAKLRTYYEYFSIPQWKGDLPRLHMQNYLHRMELARNLGYQGYWFETGLNLNATIALQLFNQLWLNPQLKWSDVTEQFLRSCFEKSYHPMKRLFTRWWYTWIPEDEIPMALNDLFEASALARSKDEQERINDLKAYLHYVVLYQEWEKDVKNKNAAADIFNYVYNSANRLLLHPIAFYSLYELYRPQNNPQRYNMFANDDWSWIKPLTSENITKNFNDDIKRYGRKLNTFTFSTLDEAIPVQWKKNVPSQTFQFSALLKEKISFWGQGKLILELLNPSDLNPPNNDQGLYMSVMDENGKLISRDYISFKKPSFAVQLPAKGLYSIALSQFHQTEAKVSGAIIPVLTYEQKQKWEKDKIPQKNKALFIGGKPLEVSSFYYVVPN